ncbi:MAG TPA: hypothetical protein VFZ26_02230, partial [Gemmatimonadales bacterium]
MSRRSHCLALAAIAVLAGCGDRTSPEPLTDVSVEPGSEVRAGPAAADAARERLARGLALALANTEFRNRLKQDLDRSPVRENKLHFQRYLSKADRHALRDLARLARRTESAVEADARGAHQLELYLPVPKHRLGWTGDERVLVATARGDREPPVAFTTRGERIILSPATPPATPVLALVPVETDFDRTDGAHIIFDGGGPTQNPPPGLYMTYAHFVETF